MDDMDEKRRVRQFLARKLSRVQKLLAQDHEDFALSCDRSQSASRRRESLERVREHRAEAARLIERMEAEGIVGPSDGAKPRKVLARKIPR